MNATQIRINSLPLLLTLIADRSVAISKLQGFEGFVDTPSEADVYAVFDNSGFSFYPNKLFTDGMDMLYNHQYYLEGNPMLLQWLVQQDMKFN